MTYQRHFRSLSSLLLLVTLLALVAVRVEAAFGDPDDTTFGSGSRLYGGYGYPEAAALQPDGKILVITDEENNGWAPGKLRRFKSNGTIDTSFGNNGIVELSSPTPDWLSGIVVQPNGKIVITGTFFSSSTHKATVWRLNADGSLDASFGNNGAVILGDGYTRLPHLIRNERGIVPTYDIVVWLGQTVTAVPSVFRLKPDGSLRTTFGSGGKITTYPNYPSELEVHEGGIYLVQDAEIGKFSASTGAPDLTFGNQGIFSESPGMFDGCGNPADDYDYDSLAFQSTGNFLIGGHRVTSFGQPNPVQVSYKHLTRHDPYGGFDTSFSSVSCESGTALTSGAGSGGTVNVQADDKIIITNKSRKIVERRMPDGTPDASFTAVSTTPHVIIQPDGKILVIGMWYFGQFEYLALSRYLP